MRPCLFLVLFSSFAAAQSRNIEGPFKEYLPKLHFSPDGRYILVETYAVLTVLTVDLFALSKP